MDFEQKVRSEHYKNDLPYGRQPQVLAAYNQREHEVVTEFMTDLKAWMVEQGVPQQYVSKLASKAWEDGHAHGFSEILNVSYGLVEIFQ